MTSEIKKASHNPERRKELGRLIMQFGRHVGMTLAEIAEKDWQYIGHMVGEFEDDRPFLSTFKKKFIEFYHLSQHLYEEG